MGGWLVYASLLSTSCTHPPTHPPTFLYRFKGIVQSLFTRDRYPRVAVFIKTFDQGKPTHQPTHPPTQTPTSRTSLEPPRSPLPSSVYIAYSTTHPPTQINRRRSAPVHKPSQPSEDGGGECGYLSDGTYPSFSPHHRQVRPPTHPPTHPSSLLSTPSIIHQLTHPPTNP